MSDSVLKYIAEEKDIARYKISLLSKGSKKQYKTRLISIEKDFLEYTFEKIGIESIEELRVAMTLFRADRHLFYEQYEKKSAEKNRVITDLHVAELKDKLSFYILRYKDLLDADIKEINLIQDSYIRSLSKVMDVGLESHGIDYMSKTEGAALSKARARIQILVYCLARFIHEKVKVIAARIDAGLSPAEFDKVNESLLNFFSDMPHLLFKHYNDGIEQVPLLINGSLGHNNFISATYPLSNIFDKYPGAYNVERLLGQDKSFFHKPGSYVKKRFVSRGFGIMTPIKRIGNESIELLYLDIWSSGGIRLTTIFESDFFNYNNNGVYHKAISTKPVWEWQKLIDNPYLQRELASLLGLDGPLAGHIDINDEKTISTINNSGKNSVRTDPSSSRVMTAATRSESSHINKAKEYVFALASSIREEFEMNFGLR
jgi:hypothetical protein